jgi:hypothetical protein
MAKIRTILWISSIILFALSVLVESTQVENLNWDGISFYSLIMVIVTLVLIVLLGLLLKIIFLHKKNFRESLSVTIPITTFFFSMLFFLVILNHEYGLTDEYNYFSAKRDLQNGKVQIVGIGLSEPESKEEQAIRRQFGYNIVSAGCSVMNNGYKKYNSVMREYLDKVNGKGWQMKQRQQLASIRHIKHYK